MQNPGGGNKLDVFKKAIVAGEKWVRGEEGSELSKVARPRLYQTLSATLKTLSFIFRSTKASEDSDHRRAMIWLPFER